MPLIENLDSTVDMIATLHLIIAEENELSEESKQNHTGLSVIGCLTRTWLRPVSYQRALS